nr:Ycf1 [Lonicera tangutica]
MNCQKRKLKNIMINIINLIPREFRPYVKSSLVSFGVGVVFTVTVTGSLIGLKRLVWVSQPPKLNLSDKLGGCWEEIVPKSETDQKMIRKICQIKEEIDEEKRRVKEEKKQLRRKLEFIIRESDKQELENKLYRFVVRPLAIQSGILFLKSVEKDLRSDRTAPVFCTLENLHMIYYLGDTFTRYVIEQASPSVISKYILRYFTINPIENTGNPIENTGNPIEK